MNKVKTMTPEQAAKVWGKGVEFIRAGLKQGIFSFGYAVQGKTGRYNYIIFEDKFFECTCRKEN